MSHKEIMVDLETMSTKNHAAITSIGAVLMDFEKGVLGSTFYRAIDLESSVENGGHLCPKTVKWWLQQSDEAQHQLFNNTEPLTTVLIDFQRWLEDIGMRNMLRVWGNGATFDNVILRNAYEHQGWECPWPYWNDMCYRTEKTVNSHIDSLERKGIFHHALDDAKFQALHLLEIVNTCRKKDQILLRVKEVFKSMRKVTVFDEESFDKDSSETKFIISMCDEILNDIEEVGLKHE